MKKEKNNTWNYLFAFTAFALAGLLAFYPDSDDSLNKNDFSKTNATLEEQIKLTKLAINTIFNNIEIFIKKSEETDKISFEDEICEKILKMIMVYYNKDDRCYNPLKNMAKKCGFIYMKEEYFELIKDKLDNDYVPGGSILHKYWSENF